MYLALETEDNASAADAAAAEVSSTPTPGASAGNHAGCRWRSSWGLGQECCGASSIGQTPGRSGDREDVDEDDDRLAELDNTLFNGEGP